VPGTRQSAGISRGLKLALDDEEDACVDHDRDRAHYGHHRYGGECD